MKTPLLAFALFAAVAALGCGESTPASGSGAPAGSGTATATATVAALADSDLPVPADFEEDAQKSISASNYKGELDALEKDIDATK